MPLNEDARDLEELLIVPVVPAREHGGILHAFPKALPHSSQKSFPTIVKLDAVVPPLVP